MTVQVRWSQSRGGFVKGVVVDAEEYLEGMRSLMSLEVMMGYDLLFLSRYDRK